MGTSSEHYFKTHAEGYFKTQKAISKIIGEILNGDFIQSYIRYTIKGYTVYLTFCALKNNTVFSRSHSVHDNQKNSML